MKNANIAKETGNGKATAFLTKNPDCDLNYHSLFEQATDAILVSDFNGNLKDVNCSLCSMFGYSKEELLRLNVRALLDPEHLKSKPLRFDLLAAGENLFNEREMVHKDGRIIFVEANARKFRDDRILVIARDITARKNAKRILQESEANLQTILDTTDTIYVLMDTDLQIISYNNRAAHFAKKELGHSFEISKYFLDYFPSEKHPVLLKYMNEVLKGNHINYHVSYPQPEHTFNWYHVKIFPISKGSNIYGLMMAVSDITEKVELELKLEQERIKKQLEITDAVITAEENERQQISLELHDNINQLLVSSQLYIGMAKNSEVITAHPNIDTAERLIKEAIDEIRKLSHSLISPFSEKYVLTEAIDYLLENIRGSTGIRITEDIQGFENNDIPDKLMLTIYRIIQEQFNNIVKYANAQNAHASLVRYKKKIMLIVKDDGVGFDITKKSDGIGLINIRTRASLFNGKVDIISSPGNGCELVVTLYIF